MRHVALLRGLNLGPNNRMAMKDLGQIFADSGCGDVETFIQSGNVIFSAAPAILKNLPAAIQQKIADRFGYRVPVVLRSARDLAHTIEGNPFLLAGKPEKTLHVFFLADLPSAQAVKSLDPQRSPGDEFHVSGREVYMHLPNGIASTKLTTAWLDAKLSTVSTARNWATVLKLHELARGAGH
jgi:uncharacterized protein (DUF1697 family)